MSENLHIAEGSPFVLRICYISTKEKESKKRKLSSYVQLSLAMGSNPRSATLTSDLSISKKRSELFEEDLKTYEGRSDPLTT